MITIVTVGVLEAVKMEICSSSTACDDDDDDDDEAFWLSRFHVACPMWWMS